MEPTPTISVMSYNDDDGDDDDGSLSNAPHILDEKIAGSPVSWSWKAVDPRSIILQVQKAYYVAEAESNIGSRCLS